MAELDATPVRYPCGAIGPHSGCSWWRVPETPPVLAQVDSGGFPAPAASSCHCAALLPVLRRWLAATDAAEAHGALAVFAEYTGAAQALEVLAREVTRD